MPRSLYGGSEERSATQTDFAVDPLWRDFEQQPHLPQPHVQTWRFSESSTYSVAPAALVFHDRTPLDRLSRRLFEEVASQTEGFAVSLRELLGPLVRAVPGSGLSHWRSVVEPLLTWEAFAGLPDWYVAVEDGGGGQGCRSQGRDQRVRLPMPAGRVVDSARAARTARIATQEIRRDARLVDKDERPRVVQGLRVAPAPPFSGDVGASLFAGVYRFF